MLGAECQMLSGVEMGRCARAALARLAPLVCFVEAVLVDEEVPQSLLEEGAEAALGGVGAADEVSGEDDLRHEILGEVAGVVAGVALAADEGVDGGPVGAEELLQMGAITTAACPEDEGPDGGLEVGGGVCGVHERVPESQRRRDNELEFRYCWGPCGLREW